MKKSVIALSVAAALGGLASVASAQTATTLVFTPNGTGHIVIVPYFSTQSGNATLINIVNTDEVNGKVLKVRFRGASNSDDIFDFQLFMSPGDVWTANVSRSADGRSRLITTDRSCTLPSNVNQQFITSRLNPDLTGDDLANETREGYVEILNMADIPSSSVTNSVYAVTKHNTAGTAACTAAVLEGLTQGDTRLALPTRGLMANWTIINVPNTTTWTNEAATIVAVDDTNTPGTGKNVYWPQTATPLTGTQVSENTADPAFLTWIVSGGSAGVEGASYDLPDLSTPYTANVSLFPVGQANLLSYSLASRREAAEFLSDPGINASTDWVISMPTRRYYVAVDYAESDPADKIFATRWYDSDAVYFSPKADFSDGNAVMGNAANGGKDYQICVQVTGVKFYNREELSPSSSGIVISPGQPQPAPSLCGEISVLGINSPISPLGASVSRFNLTLPAGLVDGWGVLTANNQVFGSSGPNLGLPMLLRQYVKATNPAVSAGVSGTFGGAWSGRRLQAGSNAFQP
jgi:hypothetical protein